MVKQADCNNTYGRKSADCTKHGNDVIFLSDPGVPGVRSMGPDVSNSVQDYVDT